VVDPQRPRPGGAEELHDVVGVHDFTNLLRLAPLLAIA
jgi:hypothetical protein